MAAPVWPQPLAPLHSLALSALVAVIPLAVVLVLMGIFRKSGLFASACGLAATTILALAVWRMPLSLAGWSVAYGFPVAVWSILWLVFNGLWLYNLSIHTGSFDRLRLWIPTTRLPRLLYSGHAGRVLFRCVAGRQRRLRCPGRHHGLPPRWTGLPTRARGSRFVARQHGSRRVLGG
jgi:hypothetical protein